MKVTESFRLRLRIIRKSHAFDYKSVELGVYNKSDVCYVNVRNSYFDKYITGKECSRELHENLRVTLDNLTSINAVATISFYLIGKTIVDYKVHISYVAMFRKFINSIKKKSK